MKLYQTSKGDHMIKIRYVCLVVLVLLVVFLYLTPYRYENIAARQEGVFHNYIMIRVNRITGTTDGLRVDGWHELNRSVAESGKK